LYDEYDGPGATLPNIVASESQPTAANVPWSAFIGRTGYTGTVNGKSDIGIFRGQHHDDGYYWRSSNNNFMRGTPDYRAPGYHRYLIYKKIMEKAEIADTGGDQYLQAFLEYDTINFGVNWGADRGYASGY
jgi:hypothetical protein